MNNAFETALAFTLAQEGGYADNPRDPGGRTNHGISDRRDGALDGQADLDGDGRGDVPIRQLTAAQAGQVYRRDYWDALDLDSLPPSIATAVFDAAVNCGPRRAVIQLQAAINSLGAEPALAPDGALGPRTRAAARRLEALSLTEALAANALLERLEHYSGLCERDPERRPFLRGWLRRVLALRQVLRGTR